jgi:hypothetical protein
MEKVVLGVFTGPVSILLILKYGENIREIDYLQKDESDFHHRFHGMTEALSVQQGSIEPRKQHVYDGAEYINIQQFKLGYAKPKWHPFFSPTRVRYFPRSDLDILSCAILPH